MGRVAAIVVAVATLAAGAWYLLAPTSTEAMVQARLRAFADVVNSSTTNGLGPDAHSTQLGGFLTEDVEVDLGPSAAPILGRDTVLGMAMRLQPRTAAFRLRFEDVSVALAPSGDTADVRLTAEIRRRSITTGEESLDAREFSLGMRQVDGEWRIARATAVETLK